MSKSKSIFVLISIVFIATQLLACKKKENENPITGPPAESPPVLLKLTQNDAFDIRPTWSPDGETLAFISNRNGASGAGWFGFALWKTPATGGTATQISTGLQAIHQAHWCPDGSRLVFYNGQYEPNWDIYTIDQAGGTAVAVTDDQRFNMTPCFSPDGENIAFAAWNGTHHDIYTIPSAGGALLQITNHTADDRFPRYSPDGRQIAFASNRSGNFDIWIITLADGSLTQLTSTSANEFNPDWSPDGSQIAYMSDQGENFDIYIISSTGGEVMQLTTHSADDEFPAWSPDGSKIAFNSNRSGNMEIWTIQL